MNSDRYDLQALMAAATPFIQITGASPEAWCRVMERKGDGRFGPWDFVARFDELCSTTWNRKGEVLYLATDATGVLRLVGQSMSKLKGRWKTVPMFDVKSQARLGRNALFHTSSWPAIESGLRSADPPPFTVSALFRPELERLCRAAGESLRKCLDKPESHLHRLSYHVETWICELDHRPHPLWNKDKVPLAFRAA